jgi:hypothetical protein
MSNTVKLSAKLAGDDDLNGLDSLAQAMTDQPQQVRVAVVWFDCSKIVDNTDDETRVPYARIRRFEPISTAEDMPAELQRIVETSAQERTGKVPLPYNNVDGFEVEDDDQ